MSISEASRILSEWDRRYNPESSSNSSGGAPTPNNGSVTRSSSPDDDEELLRLRPQLVDAVWTLNEQARQERALDGTKGRCMLGICAGTPEQGIATLKTWVTHLQLPRGLLHGMDTDGVPIPLEGGVYIKYNSGGVYTFADIRKSNMGFDALWKPGTKSVRVCAISGKEIESKQTTQLKQNVYSIFLFHSSRCRRCFVGTL
jgi:hypothetical protein